MISSLFHLGAPMPNCSFHQQPALAVDRPQTSLYEGLQSADTNSEIKYSESSRDGEYQDVFYCKRCQVLPNSDVCSCFGFCSSRKYSVIVILKATINNTFGNKYSVKEAAKKMQMGYSWIIADILNENGHIFSPYFLCLCFSLLLVI